jgi:hypothetical protein
MSVIELPNDQAAAKDLSLAAAGSSSPLASAASFRILGRKPLEILREE